MRIPGYCTGCRRIKQVRVSGHQLALGHARGGVCEGICSACEDNEERERIANLKGKKKMIHDYSRDAAPPEGAQTWTTEELTRDFQVHGFRAPFVSVTRKSDGVRGMIEFIHNPRVYFGFVPENEVTS